MNVGEGLATNEERKFHYKNHFGRSMFLENKHYEN